MARRRRADDARELGQVVDHRHGLVVGDVVDPPGGSALERIGHGAGGVAELDHRHGRALGADDREPALAHELDHRGRVGREGALEGGEAQRHAFDAPLVAGGADLALG